MERRERYSMEVSYVLEYCVSNLCRMFPLNIVSIGDRRIPWWRHQMETSSALLAICAGNSPVPGEFPTQRPVTQSFDIFFDLYLNKQLNRRAGDLGRYRADYDVIVMLLTKDRRCGTLLSRQCKRRNERFQRCKSRSVTTSRVYRV